MENIFNISDQIAVITGGAGVLGGAMATGLAQAGVKVGILGRTKDKVVSKVDELTKQGFDAIPLIADVLNQAQLEEASNQVLKRWGRIDHLLNVAGGNLAGATIGPDENFFDLSIEDFSRVVDINLKGTVLPTFIFGKAIADQRKGSIINISSLAAHTPFSRVVGYSAAKSSIDNFTKWLAVEMASKYGSGIRVNAIAPGVFIGKQNRSLLLDAQDELTHRGKTIIDHTPMRRFGEPSELVGATVYLCSPAASFVTGIVIYVDGGFTAFGGV